MLSPRFLLSPLGCRMRFAALALLSMASMMAQTPSALVGAGYNPPSRPFIAPGMVISLFTQGLTAPDTQAQEMPLPLELAGVRAAIRNSGTGYERGLPILRVQSVPCDLSAPLVPCGLRAVTVQVPFDLDPSLHHFPSIALFENGVESHAMEFALRDVQPTLLNRCHLLLQSFPGPCESASLITHADGTLVSPNRPARASETLVFYYVGLGTTSPFVQEGQASPLARTVVTLTAEVGGAPVDVPYAGLVPGTAGLYQVNVRMPDATPPLVLTPTSTFLRILGPGFTQVFNIPTSW